MKCDKINVVHFGPPSRISKVLHSIHSTDLEDTGCCKQNLSAPATGVKNEIAPVWLHLKHVWGELIYLLKGRSLVGVVVVVGRDKTDFDSDSINVEFTPSQMQICALLADGPSGHSIYYASSSPI